ncbi:hypothetical protein LTR47_010988 [Exophiala xenobiotica]|nr:hypothetical protein LTR41_011467 [Exophiala xenobiotica]KAK5215597.1 hypothetical protein LTR72_011368 [Exophiala xenobiotica]KAK5220971.1 hypothetical protein LTR47_010988 [Exophiala xenobiotica]KAK5243962.1 hypothetical protein LTS06_010385 [Exophiala xenobiotica]KAK5285238.1 hypothetical protein LTR14_011106 [Exophiala xenobiotica]
MERREHDFRKYNSKSVKKLERGVRHCRPPSDRETVVVYEETITTAQHKYSTRSWMTIQPICQPPHTFFQCQSVTFGFCCESHELESVKADLRRGIDLLLQVVYPQVTCDLGQVPSFTEVAGSRQIPCRAQPPQPPQPPPSSEPGSSSSSSEPASPPAVDWREEDIVRTAKKISENLEKNTPLLEPSKVSDPFPDAVKLYQCADLLYQRAELLGDLSKRLKYSLKLTAGTIHHFHARWEGKALTADEVVDIETGCRPQLRRWEGRSSILNSAVAALIPQRGRSAFRIYEAAIRE